MLQKIKVCFWVILTLLIINCGSVFASVNLTKEELIQILDKANLPVQTESVLDTMLNTINEYDYLIIKQESTTSAIDFYMTNNKINFYEKYGTSTNSIELNDYALVRKRANDRADLYEYETGYINFNYNSFNIVYTNTNIYFQNTSTIYLEAGYKKPTDLFEEAGRYKMPYFEFSTNKIGLTTINNNKIDTFYKTDFELWTNSYSTNRLIGYLYIDKNYILDNIFMPVLNINQSNLNQTQSWNYKRISIF